MIFSHQKSLGIRRDVVLLTRACCFSESSLERDVCALICSIDEGVRAACFQESIHHTLSTYTMMYVVDGDGVGVHSMEEVRKGLTLDI